LSLLVWTLFFLTVILNVWGQTAFKFGLNRTTDGLSTGAFWMSVAVNPWVIGGFLGYCIEACCWMYVMGHAPMSVVGPMAATSYVGVVITGALLLGERAGRRRWIGAALVTLGAALVGTSLG
jgi:drug/metabolite transporter (DMT)-like permease